MELMAKESKRVEPKGKNPLVGLMTMERVAAEKKVAHSAVARAIHDGRLPAWEFGGVYLIPEKELAKWEPVRGRGRRPKAAEKPDA